MADHPDHTGFGKFVPGFEFLQNLARQATGGLTQGVPPAMPQMPSLGNWVAPTFNVEELEKRIQELKAVQFWLDQNSRALAATIQALEVQKMTLATLKGMNFNLGDVAQVLRSTPFGMAMPDLGAAASAAAPAPAFAQADGQAGGRTRFEGLEVPERAQPPAPPAPQPAAGASGEAGSASEAHAAPALDPMQWWDSITQQFQTIAAQAVKDVTHQANQMASVVGNPMESAMDAAKAVAADVVKAVVNPGTERIVSKVAPAPSKAKSSSVIGTGSRGAQKAAAKPSLKPAKGLGSAAANSTPTANKPVKASGKTPAKAVVKPKTPSSKRAR